MEEIENFADVVEAHRSQLVWSVTRDVAELTNTVLNDGPVLECDWDRIFHAFGGQSRKGSNDAAANAVNAILAWTRSPDESVKVNSHALSQALRGLAYILSVSRYVGPDASWQRVRGGIVGAYRMEGIQLPPS